LAERMMRIWVDAKPALWVRRRLGEVMLGGGS